LVALGLWIRLKVSETPAFKAALEHAPPPAVPLGTLLRFHWPAVIAGSAAVIACFAIFYLSTAFALGHMTSARGIARETMLGVQLGANCFMAVGILWAAVWADRASAKRVLVFGSAGTVVLGLLFGPALAAGSLLTVFATLSFAMVVMGFAYGPLGAFLPTLFPVTVRYTGVSIAFNCGGIIGGAVAPIAAQWLSGMGGTSRVGLFLSAAGLVTLAGVCFGRLGRVQEPLARSPV
jgi:hypothetical protein